MSDAPDRDQKQFDASPQRLLKARQEGNVPRSRELASAALIGVAATVIGLGAPAAVDVMRQMTVRIYADAPRAVLTPQSVPVLMQGLGVDMLRIVGPLFGVLTLAALAVHVGQSGWVFSPAAVAPKGNRISPVAGAKRLFSTKGLFELFKALSKVLIVGPVVYVGIRGFLPDILLLHTIPVDAAFGAAGGWTRTLVMQMLLALLALAAVDFAFEKHKHKTDLKMTREEVKNERKESEGDPALKGKRRQIAREIARRPRLLESVLKADVVVTNPTHYAVALRYDPADGPAPRVLVKGTRLRAQRIKALAAEAGIPTVENVPLARALHASVDEGAAIDESLYTAVAAVLAEIYRRRGMKPVRPS